MIPARALDADELSARMHLHPERSVRRAEKLTPGERYMLARGFCPDCGKAPLLAGPEGGCSMNVLCPHCATEFNAGPIAFRNSAQGGCTERDMERFGYVEASAPAFTAEDAS